MRGVVARRLRKQAGLISKARIGVRKYAMLVQKKMGTHIVHPGEEPRHYEYKRLKRVYKGKEEEL